MVADQQAAPGGRRIVVFGATGHTGRLVAERLRDAGASPLLVARDPSRTAALARRLGGLDHAVADASRPETLHAAVPPGAVLIATAGPFARWGEAALSAAVARGAIYLDSTGEPAFAASVLARDAAARRTGAALLPAMGYDYLPGTLAGALALRTAGARAARVRIGYFAPGRGSSAGLSRGTRLSAAGAALDPAYAWRDRRLGTARLGDRALRFRVSGESWPALSIPGVEHLLLPRAHPGLVEVEVNAGWFGSVTPAVRAAALALAPVRRVPAARALAARALERLADRPTDAVPEGAGGSLALAAAHAADGSTLARVAVEGPEPYELTGRLLAEAALDAARAGVLETGAVGVLRAFGLERLRAIAGRAGLRVVAAGG